MTENTEFISKNKPKIKLISPRIVYAKVMFIYAFLYTLSFAVGCLLFHALKLSNDQYISTRLGDYFSCGISECRNVFEFAATMLKISDADTSHLIIVFMAGFTMLASLVISAVLIFRGFSLGFSVSYLASAIHAKVLGGEGQYWSIIIFSVICALNAVVLIHFAVKTTCFSDEFKTLCGRPRLIIKSKALYQQFLRFLIAFGAILILNLIRCVV